MILSARKTKKIKKKKSLLGRLLVWTGLLLLFGAALAAGTALGAWYWIGRDLPKIERLADYRPPAVTQILAKDGRLMAEYYHQRRYVVPMSEIPRHLALAFVAAEDGEFFNHAGVDLFGIARAAWANFKAGRVVQGGSTITQQVAKALLLSPRRNYIRKIKEAILAYRIEQYLSKEEILMLYLNQNYLGHGAYGVQAAAQTFFGKNCRDLNLAESALLAGILKAPNRYSPLRHPRRARARQEYVINRMLEDGHISQEQARAALGTIMDLRLHRKPRVKADYYTESVRQLLEQRYGAKVLYEGGLTVHTACDPDLTLAGQKAIAEGLRQLTLRHGFLGPQATLSSAEVKAAASRPVRPSGLEPGQIMTAVVTSGTSAAGNVHLRMGGAQGRLQEKDLQWVQRSKAGLKPGDVIPVQLVSYNAANQTWSLKLAQPPSAQSAILALEAGTGKVRVMIGGRDFQKSQYNRAVQAHRQPGSAFKPFIYAAALAHPEKKWRPNTVIVDAPVIYDDPGQPGAKWKPKNYENRFFGPTTLRTALEHSRNVVTVKLLADLGLKYTIKYARRLGLKSDLTANLSLALGASGLSLLEMTRAYSVFADQGLLVEPIFVEQILDRNRKNIFQAIPQGKQAISPQIAYVMTHLLKGVVKHGTGRMMKVLKRPVAGKTGTTNDLRDAWFIGFTPRLVCGVWVGRDDNEPLGRRETGARAAGPIWREFMSQALAQEPAEDFPVPPGVVFARVEKETGRPVPPGQEGGFFEAFTSGTEPAVLKAETAPARASGTQDFMQAEAFGPSPAPVKSRGN
ncbi:MAG: PBP1A family penicillin-binding protein [Desulfarculaceae bacterium]